MGWIHERWEVRNWRQTIDNCFEFFYKGKDRNGTVAGRGKNEKYLSR